MKYSFTKYQPIAVGIGGALLGGVLLAAAISKMINWEKFIESFPAVPFLTASWREMVAAVVIAVEITVGWAMLTEPRSVRNAMLLVLLVALFTGYTLSLLNADFKNFVGAGSSCGCFAVDTALASINKHAILRNLALLALAISLLLLNLRRDRAEHCSS